MSIGMFHFVWGLNLTHEYPPCILDGNNFSNFSNPLTWLMLISGGAAWPLDRAKFWKVFLWEAYNIYLNRGLWCMHWVPWHSMRSTIEMHICTRRKQFDWCTHCGQEIPKQVWLTAPSTRNMFLPIFVTISDAQNQPNHCNLYANVFPVDAI